jgi:hypothetical protein
MIAVSVECVFGLWFLLSLLVHVPALRSMRRWLNLDGLLPNWYLFTSEILIYDLCLRWRQSEGDRHGSWEDLPMALPASPVRAFWNPDRRITKALLDSADAMIQARLRGVRDQVLHSMPYKILLSWARFRATRRASSLQFCVALRAHTPLESGYKIVFLSPVTPHDAPLD